MRPIVVALSLALVMQFSFASEEYGIYVNERYGYSIKYPKQLIAKGISDNGDGQIFRSESGTSELRVFARSCIDGVNETPERYIATTLAARKNGRLKLTYQKRGRDFAVVSGLQNGKVIYKKLLSKDGWCTELSFSYREREKAIYDRATAKIAASFKR